MTVKSRAQTQKTIATQSDAWRAALPKLVDQLNQLEAQASADVKGVIGDTRNQVQVNNRFSDLRNQLALVYEGESETLREKIGVGKDIEEIFRRAQAVFNGWSKLPPEQRTAEAILQALDFDFFEVLDSVTIARSRKHIETFYDTTDIGRFPERRKPISVHCQLTHRTDVIGFNEFSVSATVVSPVSPPVLSQRIEDAICRAAHGVNFPQAPPGAAKVDVGRQRPAAHGPEASGSSRCYFRCYHRKFESRCFHGFPLMAISPITCLCSGVLIFAGLFGRAITRFLRRFR